MGSGTSWAGDLSEKGKESVQTHADYITDHARKYVAKRTKDAEKAAKRKEIDERKAARLAEEEGQGRSQGPERSTQRLSARARRTPAKPANRSARGTGRRTDGRPGRLRRHRKRRKLPSARRRNRRTSNPANLIVLLPVSPLIVNEAARGHRRARYQHGQPADLPPAGHRLRDRTTVKIAEHYGFDTAKTTEASTPIAALLDNPDVTSLAPGQRNNTLRTHARDLLH